MKKTLLHALVTGALLTGAAHAAAAEETPPAPPAPETKRLERFLSVGVGAQSISFDGNNTKNTVLYGAAVSLGGYFPTNHSLLKNTLLTLDAGVFFGDTTDLVLDAHGPYEPPGELSAGRTQHAKLTRKSDYFTVPVLLTLAYDFRFGENFSLRAGPSLGFTFVSVKNDFVGGIDIYNAAGDYIGETNRRAESKSGSKALFTYGASVGATWNITRNLALDLQYRLAVNSDLNFGAYRDYGSSLAHQGTLAAVWRF